VIYRFEGYLVVYYTQAQKLTLRANLNKKDKVGKSLPFLSLKTILHLTHNPKPNYNLIGVGP